MQKTARSVVFLMAVLGILAAGGLALQSSGCALLQKKADQTVKKAAQCAAEALKTGATKLAPAVGAILTQGPDNWQAQLEALATGLGVDAVICAVQGAIESWKPDARPTAMMSPEAQAQKQQAQDRALGYLKAKQVSQ